MASIFRWLFGRDSKGNSGQRSAGRYRPNREVSTRSRPDVFLSTDTSMPGQAYFAQLELLTSSIAARNYTAAGAAARASLPFLRNWLEDPRGAGQHLDIRIPALSQGGTMMAIIGDADGLSELHELVHDFDHLETYRLEADQHFIDLDLFNQIRELVSSKPGVLQSRMKTELGLQDGRRVARLISYLEKCGELRRTKSDKTYELYMAGA